MGQTWYETCVSEVEHMKPPEKMCDYNRCMKIQNKIDASCHGRHWEPGTPYVLDNPDGSVCYCCCSCFAENTQIAVSASEYRAVQDFRPNDVVYAADGNLNWKEYRVDFCTNVDGQKHDAFMVLIKWGDQPYEYISVTEDHLFLLPGKVLVPASAVQPGDQLVRPDGSTVKVTFAVTAMVNGGVYQLATGQFSGSMDGHLLNSNGVISADFALQVGFMAGQLDKKFLVKDLDTRLRVGSPEYQQKNHNKEAQHFISHPELWPKGLTIPDRNNLYIIPADAKSFITDSQAQQIMDNKDAKTRPFGSNYGIEMAEYLWTTFRAFYPGINYVMDWNNPLPNAYTWTSFGQPYILLTGGLLRQMALNKEGFSLILSQALAYMGADEVTPPAVCVGEADYQSLVYFGNIYRDSTFISTFRAAMLQVEQFWSYIVNDVDPLSKCLNPGIPCRIETYKAASYLDPLPPCADPDYVPFELIGASSKKGEGSIVVVYNRQLNESSALTILNYSLSPYLEIIEAQMDPENDKQVILFAAVLEKTEYTLTVTGVLSALGEPLDPDHDKAVFTLQD
ncbi:Hint domain-containing protein [Chitinophaga sp. YIM B06452]|uniref:Hint domain-containing protein n=1 Tax=Chitinophaga sp. YIM B06452 TaxID=3082158 RepID=UPI0031FE5126